MGYQDYVLHTLFSSTIEVFFYRHNIYSRDLCCKWILSQAIFFSGLFQILSNSRTFPWPGNEFVIFQVFQDAWEPCRRVLIEIHEVTIREATYKGTTVWNWSNLEAHQLYLGENLKKKKQMETQTDASEQPRKQGTCNTRYNINMSEDFAYLWNITAQRFPKPPTEIWWQRRRLCSRLTNDIVLYCRSLVATFGCNKRCCYRRDIDKGCALPPSWDPYEYLKHFISSRMCFGGRELLSFVRRANLDV